MNVGSCGAVLSRTFISMTSAVIILLTVRAQAAQPTMFDEPTKRHTQRVEYAKRIIKEAYETTAKHDPRWDKPASLAADYLAKHIGNSSDTDGDEPRIMYFKAGEAMTLGCDDPLIHFCRARGLTRGRERMEEVCTAADRMRDSKQYGPYLRAQVLTLAAWWAQTDQQAVAEAKIQPHIRENIDATMALLPEIFSDKELPAELLIDLMRNVGYVSMYVEGDRFVLLDKVNPVLEKSVQPRSLVLAIRGREMISYAWDAIGRAGAPAPNGQQLFADRLEEARKLLEESWKLWPNCEAATEMIPVLKAQGAPRQEMEQWFSRAMDIDSCNSTACLYKMEFLDPKWGGSVEDLVQFGREMCEKGNWAGQVPQMINQAHWRAAYNSPKAKPYYPDRDYFKSPQVWKDLQPFYEEQLRRMPRSMIVRTNYMLVAAWSEHWDVAADQLKKMRYMPHTRIIRDATADMVKEIDEHTKDKSK